MSGTRSSTPVMPVRTSPCPTQRGPWSSVEVTDDSQYGSPPPQISDSVQVTSAAESQLPEAMQHLRMNADSAMDAVGQEDVFFDLETSLSSAMTAFGKCMFLWLPRLQLYHDRRRDH